MYTASQDIATEVCELVSANVKLVSFELPQYHCRILQQLTTGCFSETVVSQTYIIREFDHGT